MSDIMLWCSDALVKSSGFKIAELYALQKLLCYCRLNQFLSFGLSGLLSVSALFYQQLTRSECSVIFAIAVLSFTWAKPVLKVAFLWPQEAHKLTHLSDVSSFCGSVFVWVASSLLATVERLWVSTYPVSRHYIPGTLRGNLIWWRSIRVVGVVSSLTILQLPLI